MEKNDSSNFGYLIINHGGQKELAHFSSAERKDLSIPNSISKVGKHSSHLEICLERQRVLECDGRALHSHVMGTFMG